MKHNNKDLEKEKKYPSTHLSHPGMLALIFTLGSLFTNETLLSYVKLGQWSKAVWLVFIAFCGAFFCGL